MLIKDFVHASLGMQRKSFRAWNNVRALDFFWPFLVFFRAKWVLFGPSVTKGWSQMNHLRTRIRLARGRHAHWPNILVTIDRSNMKWRLSLSAEPGEEKRRVKYDTYTKWVVDFDKDCQTVTWLDCWERHFISEATRQELLPLVVPLSFPYSWMALLIIVFLTLN